jgi:(p)ppGpp synthase/HD superfamily hydrolase
METTSNSRIWLRAASFAARQHQGQLRKDGQTPYFAHSVRVRGF